MDPTRAALLAAASFAAGAINAVAGGGTVVSFPAAIAAGLPSVIANATNTVALTPSALASAWAYRRELRAGAPELKLLALPAALGGGLGAGLLLLTPERLFDASVPFLLLAAVALLVAQNIRAKPAAAPNGASIPQGDAPTSTTPLTGGTRGKLGALALALLASTYGGYFGAGTGIMMLAVLGMLGIADMHRANAVKTVLGALINGTAAIGLVIAGAVDPAATPLMAAGGIAGGFAGAALARKVDQAKVRWVVVAIGAALAAITAWQRWR